MANWPHMDDEPPDRLAAVLIIAVLTALGLAVAFIEFGIQVGVLLA
jgi:hypothetical protein